MTSSEGFQHHFNALFQCIISIFLLFSHQKEFSCYTYIYLLLYWNVYQFNCHLSYCLRYTISAASSARGELTNSFTFWPSKFTLSWTVPQMAPEMIIWDTILLYFKRGMDNSCISILSNTPHQDIMKCWWNE